MKKCFLCKKEPASISLKILLNGSVKIVNACDSCAVKKGFSYEENDLALSDYAQELVIGEIPQSRKKLKCSNCGFLYSRFPAEGFLSCPLCYYHFSKELAFVLNKFFKNSLYEGRKYRLSVEEYALKKEKLSLPSLRKKIRLCLKFNDLEGAQKIKEKIRRIENEKK